MKDVEDWGMDKLSELKVVAEKIKSCSRCELSRERKFIYPGVGSPDSKVIFIGTAPGPSCDRILSLSTAHPFIEGARTPFYEGTDTGKILNSWFDFMGLNRDDFYLTNLVKCPVKRESPPFDPTPKQIENCSLWLEREIVIIQPKLIVTLGFSAKKHLLGAGIQCNYGECKEIHKCYGGKNMMIKFFPLPHPMNVQGYSLRPCEISNEVRNMLTELKRLVKEIETA